MGRSLRSLSSSLGSANRGHIVLSALYALGLFIGLAAWAVSAPYGATPDEEHHMNSVWCPRPGSDACPIIQFEEGGTPHIEVPRTSESRTCFVPRPNESAACTEANDWSGTFATWRFDTGGYPGGYYRIMHVFASDDFEQMTLSIRLVNSAIAAVGFFLLHAFLPRSARRTFVWTLAAVSVPTLAWLVSSAVPDSWSLIGVIGVGAATTGLVVAERRRQRSLFGLFALVGAFIAGNARADAAAFAVLAAGLVLAAHFRWRLLKDPFIVVPFVLIAAFGAVMFLTSGQSNLVATGMGPDLGDTSYREPLAVLVHNLLNFPEWATGLWRVVADYQSWTAVAYLTFAVGAAIVVASLRRPHLTAWKVAALVVSIASLFGAPLLLLQQRSALLLVQDTGLQFRYILPLLIIVVIVALQPVAGGAGPMISRNAAWWIWGAVTLSQSLSLHRWIRRYVTGLDQWGFNLSTNAEWWREGFATPMVTWLLGSLGFAIVSYAIVAAVGRRTEVGEVDGSEPSGPTAGLPSTTSPELGRSA